MALGEFDLIARYFHTAQGDDVALGIGDDAAIINVPSDQQLLVTTDTLNIGIHFPENTCAADIAYKTVAVNVSDLAAMGARPTWATLNLSLPAVDETWLSEFALSLRQQLEAFGVKLIGGDTTRGALSLTLTVMGICAPGRALRRDGAQLHDLIVLTGTVGDARLGLDLALNRRTINDFAHRDYLLQRLNRPCARLSHSAIIKSYAHAAIDVSDGVAQDLNHIINRSQCGAIIDLEKLPLSSALRFHLDEPTAWHYALCGGDDYELLLTLSASDWPVVEQQLFQHGLNATVIGRIESDGGLRCHHRGKPVTIAQQGFQHF